MADFLSAEWLAALNETLAGAGPAPLADSTTTLRVVLEFLDAPSDAPTALTLSLGAGAARASVGDDLGADATIRLTFADALALATGSLDSARALREGRLKVRGNAPALVPLLAWMQDARSPQ